MAQRGLDQLNGVGVFQRRISVQPRLIGRHSHLRTRLGLVDATELSLWRQKIGFFYRLLSIACGHVPFEHVTVLSQLRAVNAAEEAEVTREEEASQY